MGLRGDDWLTGAHVCVSLGAQGLRVAGGGLLIAGAGAYMPREDNPAARLLRAGDKTGPTINGSNNKRVEQQATPSNKSH